MAGIHLHHFAFGIGLLLIVGYLWLIQIGTTHGSDRLGRLTSLLYGAGAALTLDELALWVHLDDVYWEADRPDQHRRRDPVRRPGVGRDLGRTAVARIDPEDRRSSDARHARRARSRTLRRRLSCTDSRDPLPCSKRCPLHPEADGPSLRK